MMKEAETPMRQRRIREENNLRYTLEQLETNNAELTDLKQLSKGISGNNMADKHMYHIGGVFIKEKGNLYKTVEREIGLRMRTKKQLKEQSYKSIALIVSLTKKQEEHLLSPLTAQAIDDYRDQMEDLHDLS